MGTRGTKRCDPGFEPLGPEVYLAEPDASYMFVILNGLLGLDGTPEGKVHRVAFLVDRR